jgi:BirA family biotin operon repressor/biotin-[acetyl-CoA-carboxylase] ligase
VSAPRSWVVHRYDRVASTMDVAAALARCGAPDCTAVVSFEQTAGRGRAGRSWESPPGSSLFCTLILRPAVAPERLSTLPLLAGVAVAEAIEKTTGTPVQLKWPNDLWIGADPERRKAGGILTTSAIRGQEVDFALVGIGINVAAEADALPPGATSLHVATGARIDVADLFATILACFDRVYTEPLASGGHPSLDSWRSRAALLGEPVVIEDAGRSHSGIYAGIDDDGALLLHDPTSGMRRVVAGDLTRGPQRSRERDANDLSPPNSETSCTTSPWQGERGSRGSRGSRRSGPGR